MADKDEPSLELPSFRLRRRRESPAEGAGQPVDDSATLVREPLRQPRPAAAADGPVVDEDSPRPSAVLRVPGQVAASITGLVVGAAAVGLVWAGQHGCEAMSGTSSCGGGPGLVVLVLVIVLLALLGAALLRVLGTAHAGSTSALAVGLATVMTLLVFVDVLFERSGAVVVVLTSLAAYVVAHSVTAAAGD